LRGALEDLERDEKDEPITDEDVERFRLYITGHARTDAWQPVFERLERGELTWRKIVEDFASGNLDRETARALTSLRDVPPATPEQLSEIGFDRFAPEKAEAEPEEPEPEPEQPADAGGRFVGRCLTDDEDWGAGGEVAVGYDERISGKHLRARTLRGRDGDGPRAGV